MEPLEEIIMGSKEQTQIVKGKRTKRQRPQSPIPFAIATNSIISKGDGGGLIDCINEEANKKKNITSTNHTKVSPTPTSSSEYVDSTEEEEDMANCLILLAQGQSRDQSRKQSGYDHQMGNNNYKFNSRKFLETGSTGNGKAGYYVYECKTCNRTFPSFQALGGHRASHKKHKANHADDNKKHFTVSSDEEDAQYRNISSLSLQLSNRGLYTNNNNNSDKGKIHECSICGAEFTSGQALGGHMRRHRGPVGANTALSLTPPVALESEEQKKPRNVLSLDLDLNLPAPEDDNRESQFPFASKQEKKQEQQQQQSPLVFSAPTLVDCHY